MISRYLLAFVVIMAVVTYSQGAAIPTPESVNGVSMEDAQVDDTSMDDTSMDDASMDDASMDDASVDDASMDDAAGLTGPERNLDTVDYDALEEDEVAVVTRAAAAGPRVSLRSDAVDPVSPAAARSEMGSAMSGGMQTGGTAVDKFGGGLSSWAGSVQNFGQGWTSMGQSLQTVDEKIG